MNNFSSRQVAKSSKEYWDKCWSGDNLPLPINIADKSLNNYTNLAFHRYFKRVFEKLEPRNSSLIEVGCAQSQWLPYFKKQFGFNISGLDYSEEGCEKMRTILSHATIKGDIICADIFDPPHDLIGSFDVLVSFGVVEHFENTAGVLKACARLLKPNGKMITLIPNMTGFMGTLQKMIDRDVFDIHVPLSREIFYDAHGHAGLKAESCQYFMAINLSVVNSTKHEGRIGYYVFRRVLSAISKAVWFLEKKGVTLPVSRWISPYIICIAKKRS